jgi:hypothetical protein
MIHNLKLHLPLKSNAYLFTKVSHECILAAIPADQGILILF